MATLQSAGITDAQREDFARDGYLHIPGVLAPDEVAWLRRWCETQLEIPEAHRLPGDGEVLTMLFDRHPEVRWVLFADRTLAILRDLFGDAPVLLPEMCVHRQGFGGWHKDTTSQEGRGHHFQWEPDFLMCEVAWYLQDNTDAYAGGLDVDPGSHRRPDGFANPAHARRSADGEPVSDAWRSLVNRAGDLVIFDFRLDHRATQPDVAPHLIPREHHKYAIFQAVSTDSPHVGAYLDYMGSNPAYGTFSREWSSRFRAEAHAHGLKLA